MNEEVGDELEEIRIYSSSSYDAMVRIYLPSLKWSTEENGILQHGLCRTVVVLVPYGRAVASLSPIHPLSFLATYNSPYQILACRLQPTKVGAKFLSIIVTKTSTTLRFRLGTPKLRFRTLNPFQVCQ